MFQELEGQTAVLVTKGVYQQVPVYMRDDGSLYAKVGTGFVRLNGTGSTSKVTTRVDLLAVDLSLYVNSFGHLFVKEGADRRPLEDKTILKLE